MRKLTINFCYETLPNEVAELKNLEWLSYYGGGRPGNLVQTFTVLAQLSKLKYLDMSGRGIRELPAEIGQLKSLEYLNLYSNSLVNVPSELASLENLQHLLLGYDRPLNNQVAQGEFPEVVLQLRKLRTLKIDSWFGSLSSRIGELQSLEKLSVTSKYLKTIPEEIGNLRKLEVLVLNNCNIESIPKELNLLRNLKRLSLTFSSSFSGNLTEFLRTTQLTQLERLDIGGMALNQQSNLTFLNRFPKLHWLDLKHNNLSRLPEEIQGLRSLIALDISQNNITSIPAWFWKLKNLKKIYLHANKIAKHERDKVGRFIKNNSKGHEEKLAKFFLENSF